MFARVSTLQAASLMLMASLYFHTRSISTLVLAHNTDPSAERPVSNASLNRTANLIDGLIWEDHKEDGMFEPLASQQSHELPEIKFGFDEDDKVLMRAGDSILYDHDQLHQKHNISDVNLMSMVATARIRVYNDMFAHRYDNNNDMLLAVMPAADNDQCISQLENLVARAKLQTQEKYSSKDMNFHQLIETWGHVPSGVLLGNAFMEGMYQECLRLKIELDNGRQAATRYCSMSVKHVDWPRIDRHDVLNIETGICIPKACDSTINKNKAELLISLFEHKLRYIEQGQIKFNSLYCLPDEDSPLRSILNSPKAMVTLALVTSWLLLLVYCTYMHDRLDTCNITADKQEEGRTSAGAKPRHSAHLRVYEMLSITNNVKLLFTTGKAPSPAVEQDKRPKAQESASDNNHAEAAKNGTKIIDFSCVEGIKVISMVYIIMGHVLMCLPTMLINLRELSGQTSLAFFLSNMLPAFAVNAFFTITGSLTCYMMLKQNQSHKFITKPATWVVFFAHRYIRIMPVYALVVLYCKTLAKYTSSGPLWDYGTSSLGQRRICEQEPWGVTLLFKSNYEPPLTLCIPGSWYLSNDFQFFLVTPIFMALLYKRPQLGQVLLYLCIADGYLAGFWSIFSVNVSDVRPIASFASNGFKTYVSHFSHNYTRPQYRMPAYLIGLLIGYKLYVYEKARLNFIEAKREQQLAQDSSSESIQEPDWSDRFKKFALPTSLFLVFACCITPLVASQLPFTKSSAHFITALIIPSYHVLIALAVGFYLLMATTGSGNAGLNSFFAASLWKPLSRLSLCAVLVNVEVINYFVQSSSSLYYYSNIFHLAMNCLCITTTYMVSIVVYVLFEAPIRAALNSLLNYTMKRVSVQLKARKSVKTC